MSVRVPQWVLPVAHLIDEFVIVHLAICTTTHVPRCDDLQHSQHNSCCCLATPNTALRVLGLLGCTPAPHPAAVALPQLQAQALLLPALPLLLEGDGSLGGRTTGCCPAAARNSEMRLERECAETKGKHVYHVWIIVFFWCWGATTEAGGGFGEPDQWQLVIVCRATYTLICDINILQESIQHSAPFTQALQSHQFRTKQ